jgi:hypothetical protein
LDKVAEAKAEAQKLFLNLKKAILVAARRPDQLFPLRPDDKALKFRSPV